MAHLFDARVDVLWVQAVVLEAWGQYESPLGASTYLKNSTPLCVPT